MHSFIRCPVEYKLDDDDDDCDDGGQKSAAMFMEDRFSTLPQDIIHRIMSLLPTTIDAMALSMVSKTFSSAFLCFPIINFVDSRTNKAFFMDSVVNNFLQSRPLIPFDKLTSVGCLHTYCLSTCHRFNNMIDTMFRFAIDRNVKELMLDFGKTFFEPLQDQGLSLSLPPQLFSSETIRDLTLIGISTQQLKCQDLIISSPSIQNLKIIGCRFIRRITLGCNEKLKQVKIIHHTKIRVRGPTPCLEYLSCYGKLAARCKLDFTGSAFPKLKHLELNNYVTSPHHPWINKQLDFSGFRFLETLKLVGTCGLKEIKFRLEYLNALHLYFVEFTKVEIEAPNLVSLTYKSEYYRTKPPEINISGSSTTLKHLEFQGKNLPQRWVAQNFSEFRVLETLELINICRVKEIKFQLENLNALKLFYAAFMKVDVEAPNLVSLSYESVTSTPPEINISSSTNLKHLQFKGKYVPERWVANDFSEFRILETLELHATCLSKKVRIHLQCLKVLILSDMKLPIVEIRAPNLVSFVCKAKANMLVSPNLVTFTSKSKPEVILHVTSPLDPSHFPNMMNFIACLAHQCGAFTLRYMYSGKMDYRGLIYPEKLRKKLVRPLYNLKHLKVELVELVQSSLDQLVDSLLWLAPHPNTLSFIVGSQIKSLKFRYKNEKAENWQHDLEEVVLENFEGSEVAILQEYFRKL